MANFILFEYYINRIDLNKKGKNMRINTVSNNYSQNFGVTCSPKMKNKITKECSQAVFYNSDKLTDNIQNIGSNSVTLENFQIKKQDIKNWYGEPYYIDKCYLKFTLKTPEGKKETVTENITSSMFEPIDIHKTFIERENKIEQEFIDNYILQKAKNGDVPTNSVQTLLSLYPNQKSFILDKFE